MWVQKHFLLLFMNKSTLKRKFCYEKGASWIKSTLKPTFYYEKGGDFDFLHILRICCKMCKKSKSPPFLYYKMSKRRCLSVWTFCTFGKLYWKLKYWKLPINMISLETHFASPCWWAGDWGRSARGYQVIWQQGARPPLKIDCAQKRRNLKRSNLTQHSSKPIHSSQMHLKLWA